ncbi:MAG: CNP1-like family protein [Burkholderiales bacterium]|nr:CNP1-like family protein [Burkholderiales bacterium]
MRPWPALALLLPLAAGAQTSDIGDQTRPDEVQVSLPQYPKPENYLPFEVSATTPFAFSIDAKSLSVGADGVVRYTLIAKSAAGALNISFEGMRCADRQYRIYAFGTADKTWHGARNSKWQTIRLDSRNAQRVVLYSDYFCPFAAPIASAEEALRALKSGGNPRSGLTD